MWNKSIEMTWKSRLFFYWYWLFVFTTHWHWKVSVNLTKDFPCSHSLRLVNISCKACFSPLVLPIIDSSIPSPPLSKLSYKLHKTQSVPDLLAGLLLTAIRRTNHGFHRHLVVKMGFGQVEMWGKLVLSLSYWLLPSSTLVCKPQCGLIEQQLATVWSRALLRLVSLLAVLPPSSCHQLLHTPFFLSILLLWQFYGM